MAECETSGADGDGGVLALTDDENSGEATEDFMQQELKAILLDEKPKMPVQVETDADDAEVFDRFDSVTVVQTESAETFGDGVETKHDFVLSGSYSLSDD